MVLYSPHDKNSKCMAEKRTQLKIDINNQQSIKVFHCIDEYFENEDKNDRIKRVEEELSTKKAQFCRSEIVENDNDNSQENKNENELLSKPLFKKTLSRLVVMQVLATIIGDENYLKCYEGGNLNIIFDEVLQFVILNNNYEWNYFKNKQLAKNFMKQLMQFINENREEISSILSKHSIFYKGDIVIYALLVCSVGEFIMMSKSEKVEQKDCKNILIHEYVLIAEYFLDDNHVKLFNGVLERILTEMKKIELDQLTESLDCIVEESNIDNI